MNIKLTNPFATVPTRGSANAAGWDLYAAIGEPAIIPSGCTTKITTGIAAEIPNGYFGAVFARSGMAAKRGLRPSNCVGVVDSDYRGEIMVAVHNDSNEVQVITPNERIAQLVVMPYQEVDLTVVDSLSTTERGEGGFGSTGTH